MAESDKVSILTLYRAKKLKKQWHSVIEGLYNGCENTKKTTVCQIFSKHVIYLLKFMLQGET